MIFSQLHEQRYAAHLGRDRTTAAIKRMFYWPGITKDISLWCKECQVCARAKPGPGRGRNALEQFKVYRPMSVVGIDIMGPLNPSYAGNQYIIVVSRYYTKWVVAFAVPNHTAATVADKLVQEVFLCLGFPIQIHSDQGREFEFESQLFHQLCKLLDIEKSRPPLIIPFEGKRHPKSWLDQPSIEPRVVVPHEPENEPRNQPPLEHINDSPVQLRSRRERPVKPRLMYSPE